MPPIHIPGVADAIGARPVLADAVDGITPMNSARVEAGRADQRVVTLDGEFVEIELSGGIHLWAPTDVVNTDLSAAAARDDGRLVLPTTLTIGGGATRGRAGEIAIQAVRTFELEIAGTIADFIKNRVEQGREPGGKLRQCATPSAAAFGPVARLTGAGPTLVFIHGTASSTDGSFGGLWEAVGANRVLRLENPGARINELFTHYEGRVLAFEHRSLSESPIVNTLALVEQLAEVLPGGHELHIVSHSRGGLIGELLCRGMRLGGGAAFDATDLKLFEGAGRATDRAALQELNRSLRAQRFQIGRFVRVACPSAGTTLADGRLDRYLSILVNLAGRVSGLAANPAYQALTSLLAAVLKERTRPESLPGLEAMVPTSPLARMVNRRDVTTEADLTVLGGDLAVDGVWSALKAIATDFYYREDHDLVVNTPSMLRGMPRARTVQYWIDTGGEVSHFNYFRRSDTASRLADVLRKGTADLRKLEVTPAAVDENAYQKRAAVARPVLVLVPGFMGSHLAARDGRLWADTARLAKGGFASLADGEVTADAIVGIYADLVDHLSDTHQVEPFAYDWRRSAEDNAAALGTFIQDRLPKEGAASTLPLRVLTHGSGGFVFEALLSTDEGRTIWNRVTEQAGARAVVLAYPFGGAVHALLPLLDSGPLVEGLAAIDLVNGRARLRSTFSGFEGLLELTPDVDTATWKAAGDVTAPEAQRQAAATARRIVRTKAEAFGADRIVLVAGTARTTPVGVVIANGTTVLRVTADGDGYSSWDAIPDRLRSGVLVAPVDHGGLITARESHEAIVELLMTGRSTRLGRLPAPDRGRGGERAGTSQPTVTLRHLQQIPSDGELVASGLGVDLKRKTVAHRRVRVRIVHGNLSRASSPVLVGHYANDGIVNAEAYLDGQLNGRLRRRQQMGIYPEAIGTSRVEIQPLDAPAAEHPGAVVVGLGVVGALTPGTLLQTLEHGLVAYGAERVAERLRRDLEAHSRTGAAAAGRAERDAEASSTETAAPVTALLVGSGEAGLTLRDSLHAILRAVRGANQRLAAPAAAARASGAPLPITARIDDVQIFELYEDRAVEAVRTLVDMMRDTEVGDAFDPVQELQVGEDGQQRVSFEERAAWWQRLKVTEHSASIDPDIRTERRVLKFEVFTERARIDAYAVNSLRQQANAFIADALASTTATHQNIGKALFEILVPNAIKDRAPDQRNTVLLLDTKSAAIPWELLEDGLSTDRRPRGPLAIAAGLVRQLVEEQGRQQVRPALDRTALVIGDPIVDDPRFLPLPGAEAEALAVAAQLSGGKYAVTPLVKAQATPRAILAALHERPWRILHLAMHGVLDFPAVEGKPELVSGAVAGKGAYLTTDDFNQMRYVPDLVFLNCCHVGSAIPDARRPVTRYPELAANLAMQFIKMGARVVVAAGWEVHDGAALAFARSFYAEMLSQSRRPFGEATLLARQEIHRRFPNVNTWGAYQCYGDPAFRLDGNGTDRSASPVYFVREVVVAVRRLASEARTCDEATMETVRAKLDALVGSTHQRWLADAALCAELGAAYGELREFVSAIDYYKRAIRAEKASLTVTAIEQLANLQARYAEHMWRDAKQRDDALRSEVNTRFAEARAGLERLIQFAPSAERHSILGGVEKRYAMTLEKPEEIATALHAMATNYGMACDIAAERNPSDRFYPFINKVTARLAHSWLRPVPLAEAEPRAGKGKTKGRRETAAATPALSADDERQLDEFTRDRGTQTDFWSTGFVAESALVKALASGKHDALDNPAIAAEYRSAQKRGRSRRELDSVVTQIRFLAAMAKASPRGDIKNLGAALDRLVRELTER